MTPLSNVGSSRGAPMGRSNAITDGNAAVAFEIQRLVWVDGDYDCGGAYWGAGDAKESIYRAEGQSDDAVEEIFVRATSLEDAKAKVLEIYENATFAPSADLDALTGAFIEAALWSSTNDRYYDEDKDEDEPEHLDGKSLDFAVEAYALMEEICQKFLVNHSDLVESAKAAGQTIEQIGHDLWLTSNRHGVGFEDRNLGDVGKSLVEAAHKIGGRDLYIGDDDQIHVSGDHEYDELDNPKPLTA